MHVNAKKIAFGGMLLAWTEACILLGSALESNTLFLLAAAAFFVGIVIREFGKRTGAAFYAAGVLLGLLLTPNKFYVASYAAMALYILLIELASFGIGRMSDEKKRLQSFWLAKWVIFNLIYIPALLVFGELLIEKEMNFTVWIVAFAVGQIGWLIYDKAYDYVQSQLWGKVRGKLLQ